MNREHADAAPLQAARAVRPSAPLRVAMVVNGFPMLSETFVINQAAALIEMGHEVDLYSLTTRRPLRHAPHEDVLRYGLIERTRYAAARPRDGWRFVAATGGALLRVARQRPRALLPLLDVRRHRRHALTGRLLQHAAALGEGECYDVIHCQFGDVGLATLGLIDAGALDGALVVSFRGWDISSFVRKRGREVYRALFERGDAFFTNCRYFERRLHELGCPPHKLEVLYSGIDVARFPVKRHRLPLQPPLTLVTVGRLVAKKGIEDALRALALLCGRGIDARYLVVGEGPLRERLQALAHELGVAERVRFAGAMNREGVIAALLSSDIFLGPSVRSAHGDEDAPINTLKEAMAIGLPVVATRHGGIPELVIDGESGCLVPERDPPAIAEAVAHLVSRQTDWPVMAAAARAHVHSRFNLAGKNMQLAAVYDRAVVHRRRRAAASPSPVPPCPPP